MDIKFKFLDKRTGEVTEWDSSQTSANLHYFFSSEHITPLRFTGYQDKNGVDIYEGDRCLSHYNGTHFTVRFGQYLVDEVGAEDMIHTGFYMDCDDEPDYGLNDACANYEVVGGSHA